MTHSRKHFPARLVAVLCAAAAVAACDEQDAGPTVDLTPQNTGVLVATVFRDTAIGTTPKYAPASGLRVNVFRPGETVALRSATALSNGQIVFVGLAPGTYIVAPAARPLSTFPGAAADTITVTAADTVASDTIRVRLGASISGLIASDVFNQVTTVRTRYAGAEVIISREIAPNTNTWAEVARDTTDVTGAFSVNVTPGAARYRLAVRRSQLQGLNNDTLQARGTGFSASATGDTIFFTSAANRLTPDRSEVQNILLTLASSITGSVFRDPNANGVLDLGEGLAAGDTVRVQLRDSTGTRIISTSGNLTSASATSNRFTFSSILPGKYVLRVDQATARFAATTPAVNTAALFARADTVVVSNSANVQTNNIPIPLTP